MTTFQLSSPPRRLCSGSGKGRGRFSGSGSGAGTGDASEGAAFTRSTKRARSTSPDGGSRSASASHAGSRKRQHLILGRKLSYSHDKTIFEARLREKEAFPSLYAVASSLSSSQPTASGEERLKGHSTLDVSESEAHWAGSACMSRASSTDSFVRSASQLSVVETEVQPETIVGDLRPPFANPLCSEMEVDMRNVDKPIRAAPTPVCSPILTPISHPRPSSYTFPPHTPPMSATSFRVAPSPDATPQGSKRMEMEVPEHLLLHDSTMSDITFPAQPCASFSPVFGNNRGRKARFTMGFKRGCERCGRGEAGHFSHIDY